MGECLNGSWIDYGAQNPPGGGEVIPAGSQSFTGNGTFTAPYTGVYTVVLMAGIAASGDGGNGSAARYIEPRSYSGGGGGGGGSSYVPDQPLIVVISLISGENVSITINTSLTSFGNYASISTGVSGGNGTSGSQANAGSGGMGGTTPTISTNESKNILYSIVPNYTTPSLSGMNGESGTSNIYSVNDGERLFRGGIGGTPVNNIVCNGGGKGGDGGAIYFARYSDEMEFIASTPKGSGRAARAGRIDISWGNQ